MMVYLTAAREALDLGAINGSAWIPTDKMAVDSCTKAMRDVCWKQYYNTGSWRPHEVIICERVEKGRHAIRKPGSGSGIALVVSDESEITDNELYDDELQCLYAKMLSTTTAMVLHCFERN